MKNKIRLYHLLIVIVLLLSSCNLPSNNVDDIAGTAAAQTVQALLTSPTPLGGVAYTLTFTPLPGPSATNTLVPPPSSTSTPVASPTSNCNVAQFITDVTIPDGTVMTPNQAFTKKWRIKNIGSCTWTGFSMVFDSGDSMNGPATKAISTVNPNQEIDLDVNLAAPATPGNYRGFWRIVTSGSVLVPMVNGNQGKTFYVDIKVANATSTPTNTPAAFAVTSVNYSVGTFNESGYTACPIVTANITANGAGTVTYHWVRPDGNSTSGTLTFGSAGTQSVTEKWYLGSAAIAPFWLGVYIDTPNHQDFGHTNISPCTSP